ncbi:GyrI-like domain-containing protein [Gordonia sp. GONU]|uniref:GyrI-like domain-containing protein n=1 Tax=Gordonia sp. GONU TaxID=2972949 RepID=UPI0021ACFF86|nr:GyrI-like domain-containing protein [Gordonia sp. GONU]MCR8895448.1 GyrI-like domain-containing protein [Gordonia sp. GONU]
MTDPSTEPQIVELTPARVAVHREKVPMTGLPQFFDRSFHAVDDAMRNAGASVVGPPLGLYHGMPTDTVDVAAGFPTDRDVSVDGEVTTETLPGGRAAQILHIGSYDAMEQTYGRLMQWMQAQNLRPAGVMWESYLTEPDENDLSSMQTLIVWPLED